MIDLINNPGKSVQFERTHCSKLTERLLRIKRTGCSILPEYAPLTVSFSNESEGNIIITLWDFGDGTTSGDYDPIHTYYKPGRYTVSLIVSSGTDDSKTLKKFLIIAKPTQIYADFSCDLKSGNAPLKVKFSSRYTHPDARYQWDFGDGRESNEKDPTHIYEEPGIYTVTQYITQSGFTEERRQKNLIEIFSIKSNKNTKRKIPD
ncbi:PKD domain-containing protein [Methanospirillum stamsii]|uniref:PKD domain-containing protein n=1 Tax=Methanospirillum stamsii TaxID=1277351 RepID=A0A2V2MWJ0_9EURY|nr:PKD domain-containing protein [Methanospirillum stamsii]PWR69776.1 hypothetical protein DLD82_16945 [Methanospirillum stamsii]